MFDSTTMVHLRSRYPLVSRDRLNEVLRWVERHDADNSGVNPLAMAESILRKVQEQEERRAADPQPVGFPRATPEWGQRADNEVAYRELAKIRALLGDRETVTHTDSASVPFSAQEG